MINVGLLCFESGNDKNIDKSWFFSLDSIGGMLWALGFLMFAIDEVVIQLPTLGMLNIGSTIEYLVLLKN